MNTSQDYFVNCAPQTCAHFEQLPYAKITDLSDEKWLKLKKRLASEKNCQLCSKPGIATYICLNPDCLFVGCGRDDKRHALEHYRTWHKPALDKLHAVALDVNALQCWCYECNDVVAPPIFSAFEVKDEDLLSRASSLGPGKKKSTRGTSTQPPSGVVGLVNLGNSCYMNAAIQALLNCPSLMNFFQYCSAYVYLHSHHRISECFLKLVETIMTSNMQIISPSRLVREIKLINPMFHGYTQQDTMDFVRCVFERLHDELRAKSLSLSSSATQPPLLTDGADADAQSIASNSSVRRSERIAKSSPPRGKGIPSSKGRDHPTQRSIISDTFGGILRSEIHCLKCGNVSVKDDLFFDASLPICGEGSSPKSSGGGGSGSAGSGGERSSFGYIGNFFNSIGESMGLNGKAVKLESCLAAFCAPEALEGKDRYRCEKCKEHVSSTKTLKFRELPQVLCIQLKRFRHESYFSSKINTPVIFPMDILDMRPFLHDAASEISRYETRYYLSSIISHRGTFSGGHYVAYCRHLISGLWLEFDDSTVTVVSEEDVTKVQAYALFYSKVDWTIRKDREEWQSIISQSIDEVGEERRGVYVSRLWFNRWCSLADPGPIDNGEIICPHGKIRPEREVDPITLVQYIPRKAFDHFASHYGLAQPTIPLMTEPEICGACQEAERELEARRKREEHDIHQLDTSSIKPGEYWYLISSSWLQQWGQFKSGQAPPPGPISNHLLFPSPAKAVDGDAPPRSPSRRRPLPSTSTSTNTSTTNTTLMPLSDPLPNLSRGTHYRGVNRRVWEYFHKIYGGGPLVVRKTINIYTPPPPEYSPPTPDDATHPEDVYVDVIGH